MVAHVALTGGIASGKSVVADRLAELGAIIIDSDQLSRQVVEPGSSGLAQVDARFGPGVITDAGELDRSALAEIIFADSQARADLEAIIHPRVRALSAVLAEQAPPDAVVVHVIPLLVETAQADAFDRVIVVDTDPDSQRRRLRARDGLDDDSVTARMSAQASREARLARADLVITNDGSVSELCARVDQLWPTLRKLARDAI